MIFVALIKKAEIPKRHLCNYPLFIVNYQLNLYAHTESNRNQGNRNPSFYPLNYGRKQTLKRV